MANQFIESKQYDIKDNVITLDEMVESDLLVLYFANCNSQLCRAFTKMMRKYFNWWKKNEDRINIVYIFRPNEKEMELLKKDKVGDKSQDSDAEADQILQKNAKFFKENMDWVSLDLKDTKKHLKIIEDYKIDTKLDEPNIIVLDRKGNEVSRGISSIQYKGPKIIKNWLSGADLSYPEAQDPFTNIQNGQIFQLEHRDKKQILGFDGVQREGAKALICPAKSDKAKTWIAKEAGDSSFSLHPKDDPSYVLAVKEDNTKKPIMMKFDGGSFGQRWMFTIDHVIINMISGVALVADCKRGEEYDCECKNCGNNYDSDPLYKWKIINK